MKRFKMTLVVDVFVDAISVEAAQSIADEMDYKFTNPDTGEELESEIVDCEIKKVSK